MVASFLFFSIQVLATTAPAQLAFNISSSGNAQVDAGFQMAANYWSSKFNDNATINITAGWSDLGSNVLGSSQNAFTTYSYSSVRTALGNNIVTSNDQTFLNGFGSGTTFSAYANNMDTGYYTATGLSNVWINRANAKALGLLNPQAAANDSTITFNSTFNFDFDPTDGISAGQLDFVGIAIHEIGHTMGFASAVDIIGSFGNNQPLNNFGPNLLDFTRFSADSIANAGSMDVTYDTRPKYFSIDGGATPAVSGINHWSLGGANDGRQASHWKDNLDLGIMDPTAAPAGQLNVVTELDLMAIDILGWDRVAIPEPATLVFTSLIGIAMANRRRRPASF